MNTNPLTRQYVDALHQDLRDCESINGILLQVIQALFDVVDVHQIQLPCARLVPNMTLADIHQQIIDPLQEYVRERTNG